MECVGMGVAACFPVHGECGGRWLREVRRAIDYKVFIFVGILWHMPLSSVVGVLDGSG
jgi:hypothetical protein